LCLIKPPIIFAADYLISSNLTLGLFVLHVEGEAAFNGSYPVEIVSSSSTNPFTFFYGIEYSEWNYGINAAYHFNFGREKGLDSYVAVRGMYQVGTYYAYEFKGKGTTAANLYELSALQNNLKMPFELEYNSLAYSDQASINIAALRNDNRSFSGVIAAGANYFVNNHFAIFAELSIGKVPIQAGFTFRI